MKQIHRCRFKFKICDKLMEKLQILVPLALSLKETLIQIRPNFFSSLNWTFETDGCGVIHDDSNPIIKNMATH